MSLDDERPTKSVIFSDLGMFQNARLTGEYMLKKWMYLGIILARNAIQFLFDGNINKTAVVSNLFLIT